MTAQPPAPTVRLLTPAAAGPIAILQLEGNPADLFARLALRPVPFGGVALRDLLGIDRGLVTHPAPDHIQLMPHGGIAVVRQLLAALALRGIPQAATADPRAIYPEARSEIEAHALHALARAASPLAIDLLLDQPRRWSRAGATSDPALDRVLARLLDPPVVVAIGPPNVGKSTLTNALAGRAVSIVADLPGTTRDHVGVTIDLAGLVVRWVDTPGLRDTTDPIESEAAAAAAEVARHATLLVLCGDPSTPAPGITGGEVAPLTITLRSDLGPPDPRADLAVSIPQSRGLSALVTAIRDRLVRSEALADPRPWRFWP